MPRPDPEATGTPDRSPTRVLHARAKEHLDAGELPESEQLLLEAREHAEGDDEVALVDGTLAFVEAEQGRYDAGLRRCLDALELPGLSREAGAVLRGQLATLHLMGGETARAIELFSAAIPELSGAQRTMLLLNRGTARLTVGDLEGARSDFESGLATDDPLQHAKLEHNLGYVHLLRGELVDALRRMERAHPTFEPLGPAVLATVDIDRSEVLAAAGLTGEAIGLLRAVLERLAGSDLWRYQADVEIRLARLLTGREAVALARAAASRYADHGNAVEADLAAGVAVQLDVAATGAPGTTDLGHLAGRLEAAGRADSAQTLRIRAAGLRGEAPELPAEGAPLATRLLAGEVAAGVALERGDLAGALDHAAAAADELESWQRTIGSLELQHTTLRLGQQVIRLGQRAALAREDPAALLEWSERARGLTAHGVPRRPPEELGDLLARLRHLGPDADREQRAGLVEQIRLGRWQAGGSVEPGGRTTLAELRSALDRTRFVSLLEVDGELVALLVAADRVEVVRLGPSHRLRALRDGLAADLAAAAQVPGDLVRRGLRERLATIDALVGPVLSGASSVVLTVPAPYARVPWGQLDSLRGVAVSLPTSATAWVRGNQRRHRAGHPAVAVLVGPGTGTGDTEVAGVEAAWRGAADLSVVRGPTCAGASELAVRSDVLHLIAHGRDRDAHPLFASTDLADGPWFGHDVELLPQAPRLVVLSACGVGGGSLGMARAWLHAGAERVVAAPADISEQAAASRYPRLHALLADGCTPEQAVAGAFGPDALDCAVQCYGPS